jgi:predicted nuclease of predicted toxin-antitoxin system
VRFLVDMNLSPAIADGLRSLRFDAVHVRDVGLARASDEEIFRFAAGERRTIVTADLDFADIVAASGIDVVSVILLRLRNTSPSRGLARLEAVLSLVAEPLATGAIVIVSEDRIRIRSLPIAP